MKENVPIRSFYQFWNKPIRKYFKTFELKFLSKLSFFDPKLKFFEKIRFFGKIGSKIINPITCL
jgi:hypothetical protein